MSEQARSSPPVYGDRRPLHGACHTTSKRISGNIDCEPKRLALIAAAKAFPAMT